MAAILALLCVPVSAAAAQTEGCRVEVQSCSTLPGGTISLEVRITGNPGFTNLGIALEYDADRLTLTGIRTGDDSLLSGSRTAANPNWQDPQGGTRGYITAASPTEITGDGLLFTADFAVSSDFYGLTEVTPRVAYLRSNESSFPEFADISAEAAKAEITAILPGDISADGIIEYDDVMLAYREAAEPGLLTQFQRQLGDMDGNGQVDESDARAIYQIYTGGQ